MLKISPILHLLKTDQGADEGNAVVESSAKAGSDLAQERQATISLIEILVSRLSQIEGGPVALIKLNGLPEHSNGRCLYEGEVILHVSH